MAHFDDVTGLNPGASSCLGKVKYGHEETAIRAAAEMRRKHGSVLESYKCRHCPAWHIGHKPFSTWTPEQLERFRSR